MFVFEEMLLEECLNGYVPYAVARDLVESVMNNIDSVNEFNTINGSTYYKGRKEEEIDLPFN